MTAPTYGIGRRNARGRYVVCDRLGRLIGETWREVPLWHATTPDGMAQTDLKTREQCAVWLAYVARDGIPPEYEQLPLSRRERRRLLRAFVRG